MWTSHAYQAPIVLPYHLLPIQFIHLLPPVSHLLHGKFVPRYLNNGLSFLPSPRTLARNVRDRALPRQTLNQDQDD